MCGKVKGPHVKPMCEPPRFVFVPYSCGRALLRQGRLPQNRLPSRIMRPMSFKAETYRILIASPSDMVEERQVATEAIDEWNAQHAAAESIVLLPVKWETHALPQVGIRPQQAINEQLVGYCDILIGMFWTRLGTDTQVAESGTVEEIDQFVGAGKPAMLYFSNRPINPSKIDPGQQAKLRKFKEATYTNAIVGSFSELIELRQILLRDLVQQVRILKSKGNIRTVEDARAENARRESLESSTRVLENYKYAFGSPKLSVSVGPKLAYRQIAGREELFSFVQNSVSKNHLATPDQAFDPNVQMNALFWQAPVKRYQGGIYCFEEAANRDAWSRRDGRMSTTKFLSFDQFGFVNGQIALWECTYYTRFNPGGGPAGASDSYYFWHIVLYLRHILSWALKFYAMFPLETDLILKISLEEVRGHAFKLTRKAGAPHVVLLSEVTAEDLTFRSDSLEEQMRSLIVEGCYQLLWNIGGDEPPVKSGVEQEVSHFWDGSE